MFPSFRNHFALSKHMVTSASYRKKIVNLFTSSFLWLNVSTSNFVVLVYLQPNFPYHFQPPDSDQYHTHSPERPYIEYTQIPSPIYQYVISLFMILPIRRGPGVLVKVSVQKHRPLKNQIICRGKIYYFNTIINTIWCILSFPIVGFRIFSLPTFVLKSSKRIFLWYTGKLSKTCFNFL